jgi:hypothetical protein
MNRASKSRLPTLPGGHHPIERPGDDGWADTVGLAAWRPEHQAAATSWSEWGDTIPLPLESERSLRRSGR